jgi:hypothetical protein
VTCPSFESCSQVSLTNETISLSTNSQILSSLWHPSTPQLLTDKTENINFINKGKSVNMGTSRNVHVYIKIYSFLVNMKNNEFAVKFIPPFT